MRPLLLLVTGGEPVLTAAVQQHLAVNHRATNVTHYIVLILLTLGVGLVSVRPGLTATSSCSLTKQRALSVANNSSQAIWIGGGGGALRSVCVVSDTKSCLAAKDDIVPNSGACKCGTSQGTLACPGKSKTIGPYTNGGLNCQCATDSDCGSGAGCNTATHLCYYVLPTASSAPQPFNWKLAKGQSAEFCLDPASVTWRGKQIPSEVWWSGGVFARTGCQPDGTNCVTGECNAKANSDCPVGKGGNNPVTIAEFTLQREATDFYDISVINGANVSEKMKPIPAPTAAPGAVPPDYWCQAPGSTTSPVANSGCSWDFGKYVAAVPYPNLNSKADYTPQLLHSSVQCSTKSTLNGCPKGYTCTGAPGACIKPCATDNDCEGELSCQPASNGHKYCQCSGGKDDCSGNNYCGTDFIPGIGPGQVFLQQCGSFAGWWSVDDLCANAANKVGPFDCGKLIPDGDRKSRTNLASLYGCTIRGSLSPGNGTSCYNKDDAAKYPKTCCGCATYDQGPGSLGQFWPTNGTSACHGNDTTWASQVQPFLVNLKQACPTAYAYPYDDVTSTYQCRARSGVNLLGYAISFGDLVKPAP